MQYHLTRLTCTLALGLCLPHMAIAQSVAPDAVAGTALTSLLDARIAVTWSGDVDGLAKLLAQRLDVPYESIGTATSEHVFLEQPGSLSIADALTSVNRQLQQRGQLNLVQLNSEIRLEYQGQASQSIEPAQAFAVSGHHSVVEPSKAVVGAAPQVLDESQTAQIWQVSPEDVSLFDALTKWSAKADWQVVWETTDDLLIPAKATYKGTYREAVRALFLSFSTSLVPNFYMHNNVVRVTDVGSRTGASAPQQ